MNILGISGLPNSVPFKKSAFPHLAPRDYRIAQGFDAAAALVNGEGIQAAAAEERFRREKGTGCFPVHAMRYCLHSAGLAVEAIDYVAHNFSYAPYQAWYDHDAYTRQQYVEVYAPEAQLRCLQEHFATVHWSQKFVPVPHHLAHAASTFYPSGFAEALLLIADGMGEMHSMTVAVGRGNDIHILAQVSALHSLGILYSICTLYLGFDFGLDEYKVMGLAPYGNPRRYFAQFMDFVHLLANGTYAVPLLAQDKTVEEKETHRGVLDVLTAVFGPPRDPEADITPHHMDIAAALQATLQACLLHVLRHFKGETGQSNLCMAGGVALNCSANGVIKRSRMFKDVFVQPAAGDDGSALGAALYVQRLHTPAGRVQKMALPLWGPEYDAGAMRQALEGQPDCQSTLFPAFADVAQETARRLAAGEIVGWFQGRMEFGPRALGNRSILADPRVPEMRARLNALIKKRKEFRPFAPAVTAEAAGQFFDIEAGEETLYACMLFVTQVRTAYRQQLPAITHVDGSARVQVVSRETQPQFWTLLNEFGQVSGMPVLLNTSFNVRGQPIVCTPTEAVSTFLWAGLDALVMGNYLVARQDALPAEGQETIPAVWEDTAAGSRRE